LVSHPRYEVLEVLGVGGMGTVYKARHRFMDRLVALKVIHPKLLSHPDIVVRFEREVRLAARLSHPNIVTAYDAETCGAVHFLVMEFVPGENLADVIAAGGPLPVDRACEYARQTALGLQQAFRRGMIHRDIRPHNLLRTHPADGTGGEVVKILDFGLSRLVREVQSAEDEGGRPEEGAPAAPAPEWNGGHTAAGAVMGTWSYMAPEQAESPHETDIRADIYSLGCTLYHMLTGRPPFQGGSPEEKRAKHRRMVPRLVTGLRPDVPAELSAVVARMLAKDPRDRYQTPAEVADALAPFTRPAPAVLGGSPSGGPATRQRFRRPLLIGAFLALLLAAASGLFAYRHFVPPPRPRDPGSFVVTTEARRLAGHSNAVMGLTYSPDGQSLLSVGDEGELFVWDAAAGSERPRRLQGHVGRIRSVAVSADGRLVLSAGEDGTVRVWDAAAGREKTRFVPEPHQTLTSVAVSPDGERALCGGHKNIWLWDTATGRKRLRLPHAAESVAFSPDGRTAVSGSYDDFTVYVWDLDTGGVRHALSQHTAGVKSVAFSPDGAQILSGGEDGRLVLWDAATGDRVRVWDAHKGYIWGVCFTKDGRRALSTSWDRTARLWDLADGRELQRFAPDCQELCCGAVSPDGRWGACAGGDETVYLWRLPP
jgi:WD40 repeat protein/tRNA A-37 threonylcarbamoyl transferase component Bud32